MDPQIQTALEQKLLSMGDDELILAHRNSEWCGHAPILEEDIAFANIAQDELGHARLWYDLLSALNGADPDELVYFRGGDDFRNVRLVELPKGDWAFSMLRQFVFDLFEKVRLEDLVQSGYRPLAEAAAKVRGEERYHYRHTHSWVRRLGLGTEESNRRMHEALTALWPHVYQLFDPVEDEGLLVQAGYVPAPSALRERWEDVARPFLEEAGLQVPARPQESSPGREVHTHHLRQLLDELQEVARLDPQAEW